MAGTYTFGKQVSGSFDDAVARVTAELGKEGFGILSDIDVAATLRKKLGKEIAPYRILGACNPQFADRALEAEPAIGALLPCNVVVRQEPRGGVVVDVMDPRAVMHLVGRDDVAVIADEVRSRLERVVAAL